MSFKENTTEVFMGGEFSLERPQTVKELRATLAAMDKELAGWGDEREISEVHLRSESQEIEVTLSKGIPQP